MTITAFHIFAAVFSGIITFAMLYFILKDYLNEIAEWLSIIAPLVAACLVMAVVFTLWSGGSITCGPSERLMGMC